MPEIPHLANPPFGVLVRFSKGAQKAAIEGDVNLALRAVSQGRLNFLALIALAMGIGARFVGAVPKRVVRVPFH